MRKIFLSGVAALGLLAIGMAAAGPAAVRLADADGSGADARMTRHTLVAMTDLNYAGRSHSQLVAAVKGGLGDARPTMLALNLFQTADTGTG
jgi:hypothetical protein